MSSASKSESLNGVVEASLSGLKSSKSKNHNLREAAVKLSL